MVSTAIPLSIIGNLDRNFRYKSVAVQIPHGDELQPIPYTDEKSSHTGQETHAIEYVLHSNFLHYMALVCKSFVTLEVK